MSKRATYGTGKGRPPTQQAAQVALGKASGPTTRPDTHTGRKGKLR